ncbi:Target of rapamycin complex 2 subunit avo2 [Rhizina undulata]
MANFDNVEWGADYYPDSSGNVALEHITKLDITPRRFHLNIRVGIDVSIRLRRAVLQDDLLLVKRIVKNYPKSIYNPDLASNTSLHLAAGKGFQSTVVYLIEDAQHEQEGISKNNNGDTPLMLAAAEGHEAIVHYIATRFPRCVDWKNKIGMTAVMHAAKNGHEPVVNILLDLGADIDAIDALGNTSLHHASAYGHRKVIKSLFERGANSEKLNRQGWLPIDYAYNHSAEQYIRSLVQDREKRQGSRAATPVFGRSERTTPQRQRASSGS